MLCVSTTYNIVARRIEAFKMKNLQKNLFVNIDRQKNIWFWFFTAKSVLLPITVQLVKHGIINR